MKWWVTAYISTAVAGFSMICIAIALYPHQSNVPALADVAGLVLLVSFILGFVVLGKVISS